MKRYVKQTTNSIHYIADIRNEYPNMSIPDDADCTDLGYEFLTETTAPKQYGFNAIEVEPINNTQQWKLIAKVVPVPQMVTMRQARLALHESGLLDTVVNAIADSSDEVLKIEWEYARDVSRNWERLIVLATSLGLTDEQLDNLFILAGSK